MINKLLKIFGIIFLVLSVILICLFLIYNEKLPQGEQSAAADALAYKMLKAVNHEAYDSTRYLEWTFVGQHHYLWDKQQQIVDVSWKEKTVNLNIQNPDNSTVLINHVLIEDSSRKKIIDKAVEYFNNDSFWLVAPHKAFDPGTERRIVKLENGDEALLISYTSGGTTPGDSYMWILDETGLPKSYKMWVSIIPIGGLKATWEDWVKTESGALLPTVHNLLSFEINMGDVKGWN